jgi:hypothetical protein
MRTTIGHDLTEPCEECPFTKHGRVPKHNVNIIPTISAYSATSRFGCHMTHCFVDDEGKLTQKQTPDPAQRCAGHILYSDRRGLGDDLMVEDKQHLLKLSGETFTSQDEMLAHFGATKLGR